MYVSQLAICPQYQERRNEVGEVNLYLVTHALSIFTSVLLIIFIVIYSCTLILVYLLLNKKERR